MSAETRKRALLAVLIIVMAVLWYRLWQRTPVAGLETAAGTPARDERPGNGQAGADGPPEVALAALDTERPGPAPTRRNLFEYGGVERSADPAPAFVAPPPVTSATPPSAPAEPVLTLKLIGIAQPHGDSPRVAILSDERGVYHGAEGAIIEGRYRIVRIDGQSVEMTTLDGSGLFVLRLPPS